MGCSRVRSVMSLNWALLTKWIQRYKFDSIFLWRQVICGIHNLSRTPVTRLAKKTLPGVQSSIVKTLSSLNEMRIPLSSILPSVLGLGPILYFGLIIGQGMVSLLIDSLFSSSLIKVNLVSFPNDAALIIQIGHGKNDPIGLLRSWSWKL